MLLHAHSRAHCLSFFYRKRSFSAFSDSRTGWLSTLTSIGISRISFFQISERSCLVLPHTFNRTLHFMVDPSPIRLIIALDKSKTFLPIQNLSPLGLCHLKCDRSIGIRASGRTSRFSINNHLFLIFYFQFIGYFWADCIWRELTGFLLPAA
jgi:hypothetical protein